MQESVTSRCTTSVLLLRVAELLSKSKRVFLFDAAFAYLEDFFDLDQPC